MKKENLKYYLDYFFIGLAKVDESWLPCVAKVLEVPDIETGEKDYILEGLHSGGKVYSIDVEQDKCYERLVPYLMLPPERKAMTIYDILWEACKEAHGKDEEVHELLGITPEQYLLIQDKTVEYWDNIGSAIQKVADYGKQLL